MPFNVPTFEQIRDQYLQAVANQQPGAAIGPDSDHFVRASATAAVLEGVYGHQAWVFRQAFPDLADDDNMRKMALQRGLAVKAATAAQGMVRIFGTPGTAVPLGQQLSTAQGTAFETNAAAVVDGAGSVDVAATAVVAGAAGNQTDNTAAALSAPPAGLTGAATVLTMTGGTDVESNADLLVRLLLELSDIAQGGNETDYKRWALSVPDVARAYVFPLRRGVGTVDVVPMPASGLPGAGLLASVQAVLDERRPVGMLPGVGVMAQAPTAVVTNVTATLTIAAGANVAVVQAAAEQAIAGVFAELSPGVALVRNQLITAMLNVPTVTDVTLFEPGGNVSSLVDAANLQIVTPGVITIT